MIRPKLHIDIQWMNKVGLSLLLFKQIKRDVYVCRCPICGDSEKDANLTRFYFYVKKQNLNVYCHNCGYSRSFYNFMRDKFPLLFEEYKRETLFEAFENKRQGRNGRVKEKDSTVDHVGEEPAQSTLKLRSYEDFKKLTINLLDLPDDHIAKTMMVERKFSESELSRLYYVENFLDLATWINPEAAKRLQKEPRIVIPFVNPEGMIEMVQGRTLGHSRIKYISIKAHDEIEKIYGRFEIDANKTVYCVEGPLDSLFVENCLATCDANLTRAKADVYIWDCQPRNREVIRYMEDAIEKNLSVVIWPDFGDSKLDINDMIIGGMSRDQLMDLIRQHTYKGLMAKAKFMQWKKI